MSKVKNPLLSLEASGSLANTITLTRSKQLNIVRSKPKLPYSRTADQDTQRTRFTSCIANWHALTQAEQFEWRSNAARFNLTGYQYFMSKCLPPQPPQLYESYDNPSADILIYLFLWEAQTFTPLANHNITSVRLKIYWSGVPLAHDVIVSIKNVDGLGAPSGADLTAVTIPGLSIGINPNTWLDCIFPSNPLLSAGIMYAIVARAPTAPVFQLRWRCRTVTGAYPRGQRWHSFNSGILWVADPNDDCSFQEWGTPA